MFVASLPVNFQLRTRAWRIRAGFLLVFELRLKVWGGRTPYFAILYIQWSKI